MSSEAERHAGILGGLILAAILFCIALVVIWFFDPHFWGP